MNNQNIKNKDFLFFPIMNEVRSQLKTDEIEKSIPNYRLNK